jgi:hypothetical protein
LLNKNQIKMAKVNKTYGELLRLVQSINVLLGSSEYASQNTKGVKKLQKIGAKIKPILDEYNEKLEDIRLDNANTDESGSLLLDEKGGYKFSKDGLKKLNKDIKTLLEQTFEFYQFTFSQEGIEDHMFLEGWVEGLEFPKEEELEEAEEA